MSLITTALELANLALGKFGGAGDQYGSSGLLTSLSGTDKITAQVNTYLPLCRQKAILDVASLGSAFRETVKKANLGQELKQNDRNIVSMSGDGATVTVVTETAHGRSTGDTVFLARVEGMTSVNNTVETITVVNTTTFTFASDVTETHTADTGIISDCPEIDPWDYAYALPSDFLGLVGQIDTDSTVDRNTLLNHYPNDIVLNKDGDGLIILTNDQPDEAYIEYVIDQQTYSLWTAGLVECATVLLASELCPVVGRDSKESFFFRQQYLRETIPNAIRKNNLRVNRQTKVVHDLSGGRTQLRANIRRDFYSLNGIRL